MEARPEVHLCPFLPLPVRGHEPGRSGLPTSDARPAVSRELRCPPARGDQAVWGGAPAPWPPSTALCRSGSCVAIVGHVLGVKAAWLSGFGEKEAGWRRDVLENGGWCKSQRWMRKLVGKREMRHRNPHSSMYLPGETLIKLSGLFCVWGDNIYITFTILTPFQCPVQGH